MQQPYYPPSAYNQAYAYPPQQGVPPPPGQQAGYYPPPIPYQQYPPAPYQQPPRQQDDYRGGSQPPQQHNRRRRRSRSRDRNQRRGKDDMRGRNDRNVVETKLNYQTKPGEISFSLLVPAYGLNTITGQLKDISNGSSTSITIQEDAAGSGTRRTLKFVGRWPNALDAQRKVLTLLQAISKSESSGGAGIGGSELSEEMLILVPKELSQNLTQSLSDLENSTNTTIKVYPSHGGPEAKFALVVISCRTPGEKSSANEEEAIKRIKEILDLKILISDLPDESDAWAKIYIPIASRFAGSVIGKNASIVRELENETGAKINLSREGTKVVTPTETMRFITAEGTGQQVRDAHKRIMENLEDAKQRAKAELLRDGSVLKVPLSVPDHLIGVIIGKGGKVLRDLQDDTGTKISIEHSGKEDRGGSSRLVEISGEPSRVETAEKIIVERLIEALVEQSGPPPSQTSSRNVKRNRSRSPSESRRFNYQAPLSSLPPQQQKSGEGVDKMTVSVPIQQVGAVIGTRGATVRHICEETGARIHIEGKDEIAHDAKERAVTITGTTPQITQAFEMIQAALAESNEARQAKSNNGTLPALHIISSTIPTPVPRMYQDPYQAQQTPYSSYYQPPPGGNAPPPPPVVYQHNVPPTGYAPPLSSIPPPYDPRGSSLQPPPSSSSTTAPPDASQRFFDPDKLSMLASHFAQNTGGSNMSQITGQPPSPIPQQQQAPLPPSNRYGY